LATPVGRFDVALDNHMRRILKDVHTGIPAEIVAVDYSKGTADVKVLYEGISPVGDIPELNDKYSTILDVPIHINSAKGGKAKITLPVSAGDIGMLYFPERDMDGFSGSLVKNTKEEQTTHTSQGVYFIPEMPTTSKPISIDPDNVIITFENSKFTMKPDGNIDINGLTITPDGNIITKAGVDLNAFKMVYDMHVHGGVDVGSGQTQGPS
jgi:hypothetical protein